ncbi:unnamed protein product [Prorocentrum cordatum]|uniref:CSD domain-containing protein n=1 Tax=Prorocentrum cordatum TaxID=2364126 RepID=A0ABN9XK84_9DINO|nr:unnamed protein product [Polarella glacialis]
MSSRGTLKNFFEEKGFGFITPDDGSEDVFAHVKENPALNDCQQGDSVSYDAEYDDRKGKYKAVNVNSGGGCGGGGGKGKGKGKDKGGKGGYAPYGKGWSGSPEALAGAMSSRGTLKNFFEEKGFGFITPDDGSEDVFAHVKENPALNDCQQGDSVSYDAEYDDRKGKYKAVNVNSGGGGGGGKGKGKGKDKGGKGGYAPYGKGW